MGARVVLSFDDAVVGEYELTKDVTVVGRHPSCDIVIDHPAVSGRHVLLRQVSRTVYAEDLASTNGIKVNGISASHQVIHHLDLIEIGRHKMHFFDDALLTGEVHSLESTVLTEYERTMLADHVAHEKTMPPPASPAPGDEEDLSRTMSIPRDPAQRLTAAQVARLEGADGARSLALRALSGPSAGELLSLERQNTLVGVMGGDSALVVRRGRSYFIARLSGRTAPRLNRTELGPGSHRLAPRDVVEVAGTNYEVVEIGA
jgi:pSer/pThr/pTyr-binding forkhead associated (FHA) protein